ncbi:transposable element Tcb2 transposase [Trichonephila clavipes]|uniref:Transposable element Tcb2 transposase n=1 Tax=Trichonephila clavipes TaxID=2585209 RepID=A0A8X6W624_TRICX|nr:transposable element Tcb2 transposase [Trichonephila clavipes]
MKQLNSSVGTKQLNSHVNRRNETTQPPAPPSTAYNRLQPPTTAYNRLQRPPTTACNRLQPPATACNRLQPPLQQNRLQPPRYNRLHRLHRLYSRIGFFLYLINCNKFPNTARGGRVRSRTPAEDRYIVLSAKRNRRTTAQQVANQFLAASGKQISRKTVAKRLRGGGLYARRPVVCVPLTRQHRTARLQWCREHHNWTEQDWACVLFSDESRFSLSSDCRRQLIWRESGTAYRPENIQEKDRYPTCSIMVWAGIMINGRTRLHVVANGTMTGQRYIDEVLLPHVRLFRGAVGDKFVFMDDNATCHRTLAVQDCLDSEGIQRLVWPARSPDLNPIENAWDALGRQVTGRNYPPTNKNTLICALTEEWDKLPQQLLDNVVQKSNLLALSQAKKLFKTHHPDEEHKPRLPDSIAQPITNMPLSRMENTTFAKPSITDSHDMGLRTVYSPDAQKKTPIQLSKIVHNRFKSLSVQ